MSLKQYTREEIGKGEKGKTRFIIHDKVYDVTSFLNEHPGGEEVLLDHANGDASDDFDDVGHSVEAFELMEKYLVGEVVESDRKNTKPRKGWIAGGGDSTKVEKCVEGPGLPFFLLVSGVAAVLLALLYFQ